MSTTLPENFSKLLPIKEVAKRVGYSRDYIARLAREGKIVASQVGRQWYVDLDSLQSYNSNSLFVEELQKKILSEERRREREVAEQLSAVKSQALNFVATERVSAALSSIAVLLVGLVTGSMFYSFGLFYIPVSPVVSMANLSQTSAEGSTVIDSKLQTLETSLPTLLYIDEDNLVRDEVVELEANFGVLLLAKSRTGASSQTVADLFSDPVSVSFDGTTGGVVRFERVDGEVVDFPFVQVPSESPLLNE
jgi:excisionase family DNA binding protein